MKDGAPEAPYDKGVDLVTRDVRHGIIEDEQEVVRKD